MYRKTKVLVCNKRGREKIWKWSKKEIKEMQEFKCLDFILNRWNCKEHIKELSRKGKMAIRKI